MTAELTKATENVNTVSNIKTITTMCTKDLKKRLAKEERDLKSLINKRMNDTIINAQREIIAQLQQDIAQVESKKLASTVALNDDVITFRLAKDGKEVSKKIALVKNNRVINSKKVDEFIAIIDNGKYEEAYPIIVAEAKALIEAGYTVTDINGRELSAEEAEGYYVILDGHLPDRSCPMPAMLPFLWHSPAIAETICRVQSAKHLLHPIPANHEQLSLLPLRSQHLSHASDSEAISE